MTSTKNCTAPMLAASTLALGSLPTVAQEATTEG
jgi:hypothetical protein